MLYKFNMCFLHDLLLFVIDTFSSMLSFWMMSERFQLVCSVALSLIHALTITFTLNTKRNRCKGMFKLEQQGMMILLHSHPKEIGDNPKSTTEMSLSNTITFIPRGHHWFVSILVEQIAHFNSCELRHLVLSNLPQTKICCNSVHGSFCHGNIFLTVKSSIVWTKHNAQCGTMWQGSQ